MKLIFEYLSFPTILNWNILSFKHNILCAATNAKPMKYRLMHTITRKKLLIESSFFTCYDINDKPNTNLTRVLKKAQNLIPQTNFFHTTQKTCLYLENTKTKKTKFENPYSEELEKKKLKNISPTIVLQDTNEEISEMTLQEAQKVAKKKDLKLLRIVDPNRNLKDSKSYYKLVTGEAYHKEMMEMNNAKNLSPDAIKGQKTIIVKSTAAPHDINVKIKKMTEFLDRSYEVKLFIQSVSGSSEECNKVLSAIKEATDGTATSGRGQESEKGIKINFIPKSPS